MHGRRPPQGLKDRLQATGDILGGKCFFWGGGGAG